jgi:hypothetical protein
LGRADQAAVASLQSVLADPTLGPRSLPRPRPPAQAVPAVGRPIEPIPPPRIGP